MAKPKITLAARILLLKEHLEVLRQDERDAGIEAHHAFEDVRAALELKPFPPMSPEDEDEIKNRSFYWGKLQISMWKTAAVHAYVQGKVQAVRDQIKLLEG
jgi:hypothetical protein